MAQIQSRGVPPALLERVQHSRPLTAQEVIVLSRHGVPEAYLLRYLHRNGVNYLVTPAEMKAMRGAGVTVAVCDAFYAEGADFASGYTPRYHAHYGMEIGDPYIDYPNYNGFEW